MSHNDNVSAGRLAGAATSLAEQTGEGETQHGHGSHEAPASHESHSHSLLDSLVEAAGVSLPDSSPAPSSDFSASSFDSGSSFSSSDSGSSSSSSSD